ncbi:hypothetical protein SAMN05421852_1295 [Thermoflavimicrobium dichotomicum]|uniref:Uncharacterized protein n=1 Tax=Thermoflavimicrobium dichotomicum TaxID=46223 RepID=A0A1I3UZ91_9BACL|nr:hypothetical protein SAMN05421852_1295 [Thermoflavimicrobium dichotomicum]
MIQGYDYSKLAVVFGVEVEKFQSTSLPSFPSIPMIPN